MIRTCVPEKSLTVIKRINIPECFIIGYFELSQRSGKPMEIFQNVSARIIP